MGQPVGFVEMPFWLIKILQVGVLYATQNWGWCGGTAEVCTIQTFENPMANLETSMPIVLFTMLPKMTIICLISNTLYGVADLRVSTRSPFEIDKHRSRFENEYFYDFWEFSSQIYWEDY